MDGRSVGRVPESPKIGDFDGVPPEPERDSLSSLMSILGLISGAFGRGEEGPNEGNGVVGEGSILISCPLLIGYWLSWTIKV